MNEQVRSATGRAFRIVNPARPSEIVADVKATDPSAMAGILALARAAQAEWRAVPAAVRIARFEAYLAAVSGASEEIAASITAEQGKPLREARGEIAKSVSEGRAMAAHVMSAGTAMVANARPGVRNMVVRRPRGVIGAITPWNFPILTPMRKISPAIAYGNAIILKPSEFTPTAALILARLAKDHFPEHLLQVVVGDAGLGNALCTSGVDAVTFTGSVAVGKRVAAAASETLAEISLELGGKNAVVVNDVADMGAAVSAIVGAAMQCAGQRCTSISRIVVSEDIADEVVEAVRARCAGLKIGDGAKDDTDIGAITTQAQFDKIGELVQSGKDEGATLLTGGEPVAVEGLKEGRFFAPTVFDNVKPDMRIAREEIFGPVLSILRYRDFDEALAIVNAEPFGLTSALFSNRNDLINRFIDEVHSGMIHINHGTTPDSHMPFGGIGDSGLGAYSVGPSAAAFYTTEHSVYNQYGG